MDPRRSRRRPLRRLLAFFSLLGWTVVGAAIVGLVAIVVLAAAIAAPV